MTEPGGNVADKRPPSVIPSLSSPVTVETIPPQLLPIYHAAGAKYHVPWSILAGINRVETDFGQNLSVSSAGAIGWMQVRAVLTQPSAEMCY